MKRNEKEQKKGRKQHLTIPPVSSGSRGGMWVLAALSVDPVMETRKKKHVMIPPVSSGSRGGMWVLAVLSVDPVAKKKRRKQHLTIPPTSGGSRGRMCVLGVGVGRIGGDVGVVVGVVVTAMSPCTPYVPHEQRGLVAAVGAVVVVVVPRGRRY